MSRVQFWGLLWGGLTDKFIVCIGVSYAPPFPQKNTNPLFFSLPSAYLNQQTVQASLFFRQSAPSILVFPEAPPLKVGFFSEPLRCQSFSPLTPSYLLKVTKFLVTISKFEFLVITEENIFAYKLFLPWNVSHFNSFLCENCNPPPMKKVTSSSPATPSKSWHLMDSNTKKLNK